MLGISFFGFILLVILYKIFKPQVQEAKEAVNKTVGGVNTVVGSTADMLSDEFAGMALENRLENQERLEELKKKYNRTDSTATTITEFMHELEK